MSRLTFTTENNACSTHAKQALDDAYLGKQYIYIYIQPWLQLQYHCCQSYVLMIATNNEDNEDKQIEISYCKHNKICTIGYVSGNEKPS